MKWECIKVEGTNKMKEALYSGSVRTDINHKLRT